MKLYIFLLSFICLFVLLTIFIAFYPKSIAVQTNSDPNTESKKPIASNQWYSSLYNTFPSQPLFAFPLAYKITEKGLGFSFPQVNKTPDTIFGMYQEDFSVGLSQSLTKPAIVQKGDWSISLRMPASEEKYLTFTLAQGVPWTVITTNDQKLILRLQHPYTLYDNGQTKKENIEMVTDAFRLVINNHQYIIVLPKKENITLSQKEITIEGQQLFVGLLDKPQNFELFKKNAAAEITDTLVMWDIQDNRLHTTYQFVGNNTNPLIALLPHQYETLLNKPKILGSYETLRGTMRIIHASSFTTSLPLITPALTFSKLQTNPDDFLSALKEDQQKILTDNQTTNGDYFLGAWYGKAANIVLLLEAAGLEKEKQELVAFLKPRLAESLTYLRYNNNLQSVIADKPEFGNEKLNDHHFHYGYYIRTSAILTRIDPSYRKQVENKIDELIGDIATTDRISAMFPFLRNFSVYEAHSWADGFADFGDGNNQESSSESIGAWYSIYLWAKVTGNKDLEETALYLYNTEIQGTKYYWFGKNGVYTKPYDHAIASIVWGGKVDFSTWFSGKTNMKYGIQILPVTPGSFSYLGTFENFAKYEADFYDHGGTITDEWGDLFAIFTSFYDADKALSFKDQVTKPEANTPRSLFLYTLYWNAAK